jgi:hypothetical protein
MKGSVKLITRRKLMWHDFVKEIPAQKTEKIKCLDMTSLREESHSPAILTKISLSFAVSEGRC